MSSERETQRNKEKAWNRAAKGRGNRWRMLRDVVAFLSLSWMTLTQLQDTQMRHKGLSRKKTHEMMEELQRAGDIKPVAGEIQGVTVAGWAATEQGVKFWIGNRGNIPAFIVRVVPASKLVK